MPGFFDTGDIGEYIDGILFIKGRSKDIVKKGGEILSLNFIENMAMKNDNVLECAAVGKQDTLMGETIILFIKFHKIINIQENVIIIILYFGWYILVLVIINKIWDANQIRKKWNAILKTLEDSIDERGKKKSDK